MDSRRPQGRQCLRGIILASETVFQARPLAAALQAEEVGRGQVSECHFGVFRREYKHDAQASVSGRKRLTRLRFVLVLPEEMGRGYSPLAAKYRSASSAAAQPVPAAVTAWR